MFAVLGNIQFDLPMYFDGLEDESKYDYASHDRVEGKPRLQWVSDGLEQLRLELSFHAAFTNPETEMRKLKDAAAAHQAMPLIYGNGVHAGMFVITNIQATTRQTDGTGNVISLAATVTLKEWVPDNSTQQVAANNNEGRSSGAIPVTQQDTLPGAPTRSPDDVSTAEILRLG